MTTTKKNPLHWFVGVSFKTELLSEYIIEHGYLHTNSLGLGKSLNFRKYVDNDICGVREDYDEFAQEIKQDYKKKLLHIFNIVKTASDNFIEFTKSIVAEKLPPSSNQELARIFSDFCDSYGKAAGLIAVPFVGEMVLASILKEKLDQQLQKKEITFSEFIQKVSFSSKEIAISQERINILEMAKQIYQNQPLKKAFLEKNQLEIMNILRQQDTKILHQIQQHSSKYIWITRTLFLGEEYTPQKVIERLKVALQEDPQVEIASINSEIEGRNKEFNQVCSWLPPEYHFDISLLQELIYFRDARLMWLNEGCHYSIPLLLEMAKRLNLTFEEIIYLLPSEIEEGLAGIFTITKKEIQSRSNKYAMVMENHQITLYTGEEVEKHRIKINTQNPGEAQGSPAFRGRATGKVKLVKDRSELHKIEAGDILVTRLTTPDFVVAMEKAAAIVTDLGGITSHAAIVSRELRVPCIVGTEIATQIFKDGDLVEVDANKGVVRKIQP